MRASLSKAIGNDQWRFNIEASEVMARRRMSPMDGMCCADCLAIAVEAQYLQEHAILLTHHAIRR